MPAPAGEANSGAEVELASPANASRAGTAGTGGGATTVAVAETFAGGAIGTDGAPTSAVRPLPTAAAGVVLVMALGRLFTERSELSLEITFELVTAARDVILRMARRSSRALRRDGVARGGADSWRCNCADRCSTSRLAAPASSFRGCGSAAGPTGLTASSLGEAGGRGATAEDRAVTSASLRDGWVTVAKRFTTGSTSLRIAWSDGFNTSCRSTYEVAMDAQTMLTATVAAEEAKRRRWRDAIG